MGWNRLALACGVCLVVASMSVAQDERRGGPFGGGFGGPFGGGFPMMGDLLGLVDNADVQKEIKVTDDEKAYIKLLKDQMAEEDQKFRDSLADLSREERFEKFRTWGETRTKNVETQLGEIIGSQRVERLKQIRLQSMGAGVLFQRDINEKLNITDEQRDKFREAIQAITEEQMAIMQKKQREKFEELLTKEQLATWREMTGDPITFVIAPPRPPRGDGDRRRDGDRDRDRNRRPQSE